MTSVTQESLDQAHQRNEDLRKQIELARQEKAEVEALKSRELTLTALNGEAERLEAELRAEKEALVAATALSTSQVSSAFAEPSTQADLQAARDALTGPPQAAAVPPTPVADGDTIAPDNKKSGGN